MSRIVTVASVVLAVFAATVAGWTDGCPAFNNTERHEGCLIVKFGPNKTHEYAIHIDPMASATYFTDTYGTWHRQTVAYQYLVRPPAGTYKWDAGVAFAAYLQQAGVFPWNNSVVEAWWFPGAYRQDTFAFVLNDKRRIEFRSLVCGLYRDRWNNCPIAGGIAQHCWSDSETCCDFGTADARCCLGCRANCSMCPKPVPTTTCMPATNAPTAPSQPTPPPATAAPLTLAPPCQCDHLTCYIDDSGTVYEICANAVGSSSFTKTPKGGQPLVAPPYAALAGPPPAPGTWPDGVTFGLQMQILGYFPTALCGQVQKAEWTTDHWADVMTFHGANCAPLTFDSRTCAPSRQCPRTPTTLAPTTAPTTTCAPPATNAPSAPSQPTPAPMTQAPPTLAPTTSAPTTTTTTRAPTSAPTTKAPTTPVPTTLAPTTQAPTTKAPTTLAPTTTTTAPMTTCAPPTNAPTAPSQPTPAPMTQAPPTLAPTTTCAPVTNAPTAPSQPTPAPVTQTYAPVPTPTPTPSCQCDHHTCYADAAGTLYEICANAVGSSTFTKTPKGGQPQLAPPYAALAGPPPAPGTWSDGVTFGLQMQILGYFPSALCGQVQQAEWTQDGWADVMTFHGSNCAPVTFDSRTCPGEIKIAESPRRFEAQDLRVADSAAFSRAGLQTVVVVVLLALGSLFV